MAQKLPCNIGGPGTVLPSFVESFLSWALAFSCLGVSGYYFVLQKLFGSKDHLPQLTTHSREELSQQKNRLDQLETYLRWHHRQAEGHEPLSGDQIYLLNDDDALVELIHKDEILRRLVSLTILKTMANFEQDFGRMAQLQRIWPRLLQLPIPPATKQPITLSLIVPCYRENMHFVVHCTLAHAAAVCHDPRMIQLVVVKADDEQATRTHRELQVALQQQGWGSVMILNFTDGTGRGPCLNLGAKAASGSILSFCHSDTKLPERWDAAVMDEFCSRTPPIACAFSFGIDDSGTERLPPGVRAIEVTANLRCKLWSLPYGDQCLSIRKSTFDYVGGFPHQCIMEDYELIVLLRARGNVKTLRSTALCSPRRWMKLGVLCVTYTNSYLVNQYKSGLSPADIYNQYYGNGTMKVDARSPWEVHLEQQIGRLMNS